ncbi:MAG: phosphoadenosine phosphosulfate reductase family protein [Candidatus Riflebacteria bacterium]|nr:phosphoadenosine phosphosulfate reductase family protein [Candidatus Riflebacteria bacterium]
MAKLEHWQLKQRQGQPLDIKEQLTANRIKAYYEKLNGEVYVSFSGGKDSTALLHQVRRIYPHVPAVFVDTGLEYPEIRDFVKTIDNVIWLKPKMPFTQVIDKYGYPVISKETAQKIKEVRETKSEKLKSKRINGDEKGNGKISDKWQFLINAPFKISDRCCHVMKKEPVKKYEKETGRSAIVGTMAADSRLRESSYLRHGCNSFEGRAMSTPMAFWLERDVWDYIKKYNIPYSKIYDMGYSRTGCMFCMFGLHMDESNRFDRMKITHPEIYKYCMDKLGLREIIRYCGIVSQPSLFDEVENE